MRAARCPIAHDPIANHSRRGGSAAKGWTRL